MILAITLLLAASLAAVALPSVFRYLARRTSPRALLVGWLAGIGTVIYLVGSAATVLVWPNHAPAERFTDFWIAFLSASIHGPNPLVQSVVTALAATAAVGTVARVWIVLRRHRRRRNTIDQYHRDVVSVIARTEHGRHPTMWLDHPTPMAYSIAGKPGFIVATDGLTRCLSPEERDAVLAHERAHLHGHHHRILTACTVLATSFPRVPLLAAAPAAVGDLVEYEADRSAARATSAATVRSALSRVAAAQAAPEGPAAPAHGSVTRRLLVLDSPTPSAGPTSSAAAALVVLVVPLAVSLIAMATASSVIHLLTSI